MNVIAPLILVAIIIGFAALPRLAYSVQADLKAAAKAKAKPDPKPKRQPKTPWMGAIEAYSQAASAIGKNLAPAILIAGVLYVVSIVSVIWQGKNYIDRGYIPYEWFAILIFMLALPTYGLALADGRKIGLRELMRPQPRLYLKLFVGNLLTGLLIILSVIALIVPIVWIYPWLFLVPYIIADQKIGPIKAIKQSKELGKDFKGKIWAIAGVGIAINIGLSIVASDPGAYFITLLLRAFAMILTYGAGSYLYRWLQQTTPGHNLDDTDTHSLRAAIDGRTYKPLGIATSLTLFATTLAPIFVPSYGYKAVNLWVIGQSHLVALLAPMLFLAAFGLAFVKERLWSIAYFASILLGVVATFFVNGAYTNVDAATPEPITGLSIICFLLLPIVALTSMIIRLLNRS